MNVVATDSKNGSSVRRRRWAHACIVAATWGTLTACDGGRSDVRLDASAGGADGGGADDAAAVFPGTPIDGVFAGLYEVPVPPELAGAATYAVSEIRWTLTATDASLSYDLPRALVGKSLRVDFRGPVDRTTHHAALTGAAGTADCDFSSLVVVCTEHMDGLLPLDPDRREVERIAMETYAGAASDRLAVTDRFIADPIGIARIDLTRPRP